MTVPVRLTRDSAGLDFRILTTRPRGRRYRFRRNAGATGAGAHDRQPIDTSSTGTKRFTVTATDKAGNQTTKTIRYAVTA